MKRGVLSILSEEGVPRELLDPERTTTENQLRGIAYLREHARNAEEALQRTSKYMSEVEMNGVLNTKAIDDACNALRVLRDIGMGLAVLTRGSRAYSTLALRSAGLEGALDRLVCRDDHPEQEAKPAAIALQRAAASLGLDARDCLMVGDHLMDLDCARNAGSAFIGVLSGYGDEALWRNEKVQYVRDVGELPHLFRHD
jgi:phosphoglycolate phosphatase